MPLIHAVCPCIITQPKHIKIFEKFLSSPRSHGSLSPRGLCATYIHTLDVLLVAHLSTKYTINPTNNESFKQRHCNNQTNKYPHWT